MARRSSTFGLPEHEISVVSQSLLLVMERIPKSYNYFYFGTPALSLSVPLISPCSILHGKYRQVRSFEISSSSEKAISIKPFPVSKGSNLLGTEPVYQNLSAVWRAIYFVPNWEYVIRQISYRLNPVTSERRHSENSVRL